MFWPVLLVILPKWLMKARAHGGARGRFTALIGRAIRDGLTGRRHVPHTEVLRWSGED